MPDNTIYSHGTETYLTPEDFCLRFGIAKSTAERWRCAGQGPRFIKLGRSRTSPVRYALSDVLAWAATNQKSSTSDGGRK